MSVELDTFREESRNAGAPLSRSDLIRASVECAVCGGEITERFSADSEGNAICWGCTDTQDPETVNDVTQAIDPTKSVVSQSALNQKSLCDYVINVATGCTHGCEFCYVPRTPNITARQEMLADRVDVDDGEEQWGSYLLYRDDLPERLHRKLERKRTWNQSRRGRGVVMISSGTDCYQDRRTAQITRGCVIELVNHGIPVRILTRSPAVTRDIDVYTAAIGNAADGDGDPVRVGSSIPSLNDDRVQVIEPNAPAPSARLRALGALSDAGIPTYVSMSPTYPTQTRDDFEELFAAFADAGVDFVFHEPMNPRGANFSMMVTAAAEAGDAVFADAMREIAADTEYWVEYSLQQMEWAREIGEKYGIAVHTWPDDKVIEHTGGDTATRLKELKNAVSPESFITPPFKESSQ